MAFNMRSMSRLVLGGASITFGAALAVMAVTPVFGANTQTYAQTDPAVQAGMGVIQSRGCGTCHTIPGIPGAGGTLGPNLGPHGDVPPVSARSMIATYPDGAVPNNVPDDLAAWISDPPSLKPGTAMPKLGLSPDEAFVAAAYLYAIQPDGSVLGVGGGGAPAGDDTGGGDAGSGG